MQKDGIVTAKLFFWTAMGVVPSGGGITYRLKNEGEIIKEEKLRAVFRGVSVYCSTGLNPHITYDLVNDTQE